MRWILRLALVIVALLAGLYLFRKPLAERIVAQSLGVPVSIAQLAIGPGGLEMQDLQIGVPREGRLDQSLRLESLRLSYSPSGLLASPPEIEELSIDGLEIAVDVYDENTSNWSLMTEFIAAPDLSYRIKNFSLRGSGMLLVNSWGTGEQLSFEQDKDIVLTDIGAGKRVPFERIVAPFFRGYNEAADQLARSRLSE